MIFYTSDQHFGHENIVHNLGEGRPFHNLKHMEQEIRNRWFATVQPEDTVYVMGDIAMGNFEQTIQLFADLPGEKKFLAGNHDKIGNTQSANRNLTFRPLYEAVGFEIMEDNMEVEIATSYGLQTVVLSHYPYGEDMLRDNSEKRRDKFSKVRPVNTGLPLIHGHSHSRNKFDLQEPLQFHIGVDANDFTPVPETDIIVWLEKLHNEGMI